MKIFSFVGTSPYKFRSSVLTSDPFIAVLYFIRPVDIYIRPVDTYYLKESKFVSLVLCSGSSDWFMFLLP